MDCVLAHDVGTSSLKTILMSPAGVVLASAASPLPTQTIGRRAEQYPDLWYQAACSNTRSLATRHPDLAGRVAAIGVSGHMLGCLPIDSEGVPLAWCMIHADRRSGDEADIVRATVGEKALYEITGNPLTAQSPLCKMLWLKRHSPDVYEATWRFIQSKDYLVGRLTGQFDSTDYSDASHAQWLDLHTGAYATDLLRDLGLDVAKLPALHRSTEIVGRLSLAAAEAGGLSAGIPVITGAGDGCCASVGAGATAGGQAYCCLGTTGWISVTMNSPIFDAQRRLFNIVQWDGHTCGIYGTVQSVGRAIAWVRSLFGISDLCEFERSWQSIAPGSEGLIFLPCIEGERSPVFDPYARGVFFGITASHTPGHFLRAAIEGVSYSLGDVLEVLREHVAVDSLRLIGGGASSSAWAGLLANIFQARIELLAADAADATGVGAAILAGIGCGMFSGPDDAAEAYTVCDSKTPDQEAHRRYASARAIHRQLYPRLKDLFHASSAISAKNHANR